jgi:hypothetical protein
MKKISLTLIGFLSLTSAAVFAQQADTLNKKTPQTQYRTDGTAVDQGVQNPTTPEKPRTSGSEDAEKLLNNNPQQQSNQPQQQNTTGSQGTVSGSTPYDTTNVNRPIGTQGTTGTNKNGTTSGTTGSGTYGTGTNGTGSGTKGTSSGYGTKTNSSTAQDSTYRQE